MVILYIIIGLVVLLIGLYLFMLLPGSNKKVRNYDWLFQSPIAHRGYHLNNSEVPENSKLAFLRAIEKGYNIEIDLNLTKDNKIVVFHDGNVKRMCGKDIKVHDLSLKELQELNLLDSNEHMMEFQEFLDLIDSRTGVLIEYKGEGKEIDRILCEESMKILKNYKGNYVIQSFQPTILSWFKKNYPQEPRGQLCHDYFHDKEGGNNGGLARWLFSRCLVNFIGRPTFISRRHNDINFEVKLLRRMVYLLVWTVNDYEAYYKTKGNVDNIIFEYLKLDKKGNIKEDE